MKTYDMTVVVIDDDESTVILLEKVLSRIFSRVHAFGCPEMALEFITTNNQAIDLVVTDLNMPYIDGFEIIEHIRNNLNSMLPVLLLTATDLDDLSYENISSTSKPITIATLCSKIEELLGSK
jgi:CheY-like chemotaxis protein